jgi:hypothetical protein
LFEFKIDITIAFEKKKKNISIDYLLQFSFLGFVITMLICLGTIIIANSNLSIPKNT